MAQNTHPDWHDLPTPDFDSVVGKGLGPRFMDYTWRDIALYALEIYDVAGNPVATVRSQHMIAAFGNNGRPKYVSNKMNYPDRAPDFECEDHIADNLAALYRLTGDTYTTHINPEVGKGYGYKGVFMPGLCSVGFAARLAIQAFIPYQPERVTHIATQLRSVTFPNTHVHFKAWKLEEGKVIYRMLNEEGKAIVDNCLLEYK